MSLSILLLVGVYGSLKNEMTMDHKAGGSVTEHWSAVRRVPGSIPGQSIFCIVRVVRPNVTHGVAGRILPLRGWHEI